MPETSPAPKGNPDEEKQENGLEDLRDSLKKALENKEKKLRLKINLKKTMLGDSFTKEKLKEILEEEDLSSLINEFGDLPEDELIAGMQILVENINEMAFPKSIKKADEQTKTIETENDKRIKREKLWDQVVVTENKSTSEINIDLSREIMEISEDLGDQESWRFKIDLYDGWCTGLGAAPGKNDLKELVFADSIGAREPINGSTLNMVNLREFLSKPDNSALNEGVNILEKIFTSGELTYSYFDKKTGKSYKNIKHKFVSFGDPSDAEIKGKGKLKIRDLLFALSNESSEIELTALKASNENVSLEKTNLRKLNLSKSDVFSLYNMTFIYELRHYANVPLYGRYENSPKKSFDVKPIELMAPWSYIGYKIGGGAALRHESRMIFYTQIPPEIGEKFHGLDVRGKENFKRAARFRKKAIKHNFTTIDLSEYAKELEKKPIKYLPNTTDKDKKIKEDLEKGGKGSFTVQLSDSMQTLPSLWELFRAEEGSNLRDMGYLQYAQTTEAFGEFLKKSDSFLKLKSLSLEQVAPMLNDLVSLSSKMKGLEMALKRKTNTIDNSPDYNAIYFGTMTMLFLLCIKRMFDAYNESTSGILEVKRNMFVKKCLTVLEGDKAETLMEAIRQRLLYALNPKENKGMFRDLFSDLRDIDAKSYLPDLMKDDEYKSYESFFAGPSPLDDD